MDWKIALIFIVSWICLCRTVAAEKVLYSQNFEEIAPGNLPQDIVVLDGKV